MNIKKLKRSRDLSQQNLPANCMQNTFCKEKKNIQYYHAAKSYGNNSKRNSFLQVTSCNINAVHATNPIRSFDKQTFCTKFHTARSYVFSSLFSMLTSTL